MIKDLYEDVTGFGLSGTWVPVHPLDRVGGRRGQLIRRRYVRCIGISKCLVKSAHGFDDEIDAFLDRFPPAMDVPVAWHGPMMALGCDVPSDGRGYPSDSSTRRPRRLTP